jgi:hypothetical protein
MVPRGEDYGPEDARAAFLARPETLKADHRCLDLGAFRPQFPPGRSQYPIRVRIAQASEVPETTNIVSNLRLIFATLKLLCLLESGAVSKLFHCATFTEPRHLAIQRVAPERIE